MCDFTGMPTEFTAGTPEDVKTLRAGLLRALYGGLNRGATPYSGPVAPQQNQMTLGAANMLSQMMGYGQYKQPGYTMNPYSGMSGGLGIEWRPNEENIKPKEDGDDTYTPPKKDKVEKDRLKKRR